MSHKVANNIFSLLLAKVFSALIVFVGYASVFRYLGSFGFGQFQYVISYIMIFSVVVDFGIQQLVIKKVSEDKTHAKKYLGNFFAVEFFVALVVYILLALTAIFTTDDVVVRNAIFVAGFGMFLNALSNPFTAIISAFEDMHHIAWVNFLDSVINVLIMFAAIFFHQYIVFLALTQALMGIMHMVVYNGVIRKYIPQLDLLAHFRNLDFELVKSMLKAALPFGLLIGFSVIYNKIDVIILSHTRGYTETGLYTAAYKYFDLLSFVPAVVSSSLYPYFSTQIKEGKLENVKKALRNYTRYMIALGMPIAFGGAMLAPALITILGGQEGYLGYLALQVLVFASAILFIYAAVNSLMVNQLTLIAVKISFANIFVNGLGNLLLVPRYGFQAAALMTVFSELVQAMAYFYFIRKKVVHFEFERFLFKPLFASIIMAALLYPIRNLPLYLSLPFGAFVYAVAIYLLRFFDAGDYNAIKSILLRKSIAYDEEVSRGA